MPYTWTNSISKEGTINNALISEERANLDSLYDTLCTSHNNTINTHNATINSNYTNYAQNATIYTTHNGSIKTADNANNGNYAPIYTNYVHDAYYEKYSKDYGSNDAYYTKFGTDKSSNLVSDCDYYKFGGM